MILEWSSWRRWHQAWARYHHYRRQMQVKAEQGAREAAEEERVAPSVAQQHDDVAIVWQRLRELLPPTERVGRPYEYARRLVLEAIVYALQTNCGWRNLPSDFPPWQTVYAQYKQWRKAGIWDKIWSGLKQPHLTRQLQL